MTDNAAIKNMTATDATDARVFNDKEIQFAQELHTVVVQSEQQGSAARITQALALYDLHRTDSYRAVTNPATNAPFESWRQYVIANVPTQSEAAVNKAVKVANLLGNEPADRLAKAGIEKLYSCMGLIDKGVKVNKGKVLKLSDVVQFAIDHTLVEIRDLASAGGDTNEKRTSLTEFTVTKSTQDRFKGVLNKFRSALKKTGDGSEPSDWMAVDALIETVATLDQGYVEQTVSGEGDAGPRASTSFSDAPPEVVVSWVADQYIADGKDPEEVIRLMSDALKGKIQQHKDAQEIAKRNAKAAEIESKSKERANTAMTNKLIKMSSNIKAELASGDTILIVDVFKDSGAAHIKSINESANPVFGAIPEEGKQVALSAIVDAGVVSADRLPKPKPVKPLKEESAAPAKFSKAAQTQKKGGKSGSKKTKAEPAPLEDRQEEDSI